MKIVIVSGYFNPLHVGHLAYFEAAAKLGDWLVVIVNNDTQVELKGSVPFMRSEDRMKIVQALQCVDRATLSEDQDGSVSKTIERIFDLGTTTVNDVGWIFANGGDQTAETIPETEVCKRLGIEMVFGVAPQLRESSKILKDAGYE